MSASGGHPDHDAIALPHATLGELARCLVDQVEQLATAHGPPRQARLAADRDTRWTSRGAIPDDLVRVCEHGCVLAPSYAVDCT